MADLRGRILRGRYRIEELIGRGGMAEVYRAMDMRRQYHVAVKVMREDLAEDIEFLDRFRREASALAALSHANIVRFYSFEREGRLAFIVMGYVEGTTLRGRIMDLEGQPLPLDEVGSVMRQVCTALHYAHGENVLHRDVKPGNIMIRPSGQVLVADFGIAKAADAATATTVMPGTPAYMAPEQCRSENLDERTDVYSLGVVAYEMLAGRRPFRGEATEAGTGSTRERIRWEQMHAPPPTLADFNPGLPAGLNRVVLKALAKERDERWSTPLALWQALERELGAAGIARQAMVALPASSQQLAPAAAAVRAEGPSARPAGTVQAGAARPGSAATSSGVVAATAPPDRRRRLGWAVAGVAAVVLVLVALLALLPDGERVPNVQAMELEMALGVLEGAGLEGVVQNPDSAAAGRAHVRSQEPPSGTRLAEGSEVFLWIRATEMTDTPVPARETVSLTTVPPIPTVEWPALTEILPAQAGPGQEVQVQGRGGFLSYADGLLDESQRSYDLLFDGERVGQIGCYAGQCQGSLTVPEDSAPGGHEVATEGGSQLALEIVGAGPTSVPPTATRTATPGDPPDATRTPSPTPSATPSPTPTATGTATRSPTPTHTPTTPQPPPQPKGRIAFVSERDGNRDIYRMKPDGKDIVRLTSHSAEDRYPAWSPNGNRIAFCTMRDGNWEIYVMDANGGDPRNLTNAQGNDRKPVWSPDGSQIAFMSDRSGNSEIYVMKADGSGQRNVTNHSSNDRAPAWSPDGKRIAFASNRSGNLDIWVMNVSGGGETQLTRNGAKDTVPAWAPKGGLIAFVSERDGNAEIYVVNASGGGERNLTGSGSHDLDPWWSPDGQRVVFMSERSGSQEVYVINVDGSGATHLTQHPAYDGQPNWSLK